MARTNGYITVRFLEIFIALPNRFCMMHLRANRQDCIFSTEKKVSDRTMKCLKHIFMSNKIYS